MCTLLGWIPRGCKPEDAAIHLNLHVPKELRFALHQLFWLHPVSCDICSGSTITTEVRPFTGTGVCPIEGWLNRTGPGPAPRRPVAGAGGAADDGDEHGDGRSSGPDGQAEGGPDVTPDVGKASEDEDEDEDKPSRKRLTPSRAGGLSAAGAKPVARKRKRGDAVEVVTISSEGD